MKQNKQMEWILGRNFSAKYQLTPVAKHTKKNFEFICCHILIQTGGMASLAGIRWPKWAIKQWANLVIPWFVWKKYRLEYPENYDTKKQRTGIPVKNMGPPPPGYQHGLSKQHGRSIVNLRITPKSRSSVWKVGSNLSFIYHASITILNKSTSCSPRLFHVPCRRA